MFNDFSVKSFKGEYFVRFIQYQEALSHCVNDGDVAIVDSNVFKLYPDIENILAGCKIIQIEANEDAKTYRSIGTIMESVISNGFSKNNRLISIGGGVVQDISSFSASVMFRGVDWIFFPTNLLTQCDSCIGSKTSVNLGKFKNQLGGFHPPRHIFIDFSFIDTLNRSEISSGLGEMMHYFLTEESTKLVELNTKIVGAFENKEILGRLIQDSLFVKRKMVEVDEFDKGPRNIFNYGHTFGHAIESCTGYMIPHGIAVAYGIDLANLISVKLGLANIEFRNEVREILAQIWQETPLPDLDITEYFEALSRDKKNIGSEIKVILTEGVGTMFKTTLETTPQMIDLITRFFTEKLYMR